MSDGKVPDEKDTIESGEHLEHAFVDDLEAGPKSKYAANTQMDDAAKLLAEAGGHVEYSPADSKRVLRKIDLYVCLPMCLVYCIQQVSTRRNCTSLFLDAGQLDKSSISYAAVFGIQVRCRFVLLNQESRFAHPCRRKPTWSAPSTRGSARSSTSLN